MWDPEGDKAAQENYRARQEALQFERRTRSEQDAALQEQFGQLRVTRDYAAKGGTQEESGEDADPCLQGRDEEGWRALDDMPPLALFRSPLSHVRSIPKQFHEDWAGIYSDIMGEVIKAKHAGTHRGLERALKWLMVAHDLILRVDGQRSGKGSAKKGRSHAGMAARFQAWRDGRKADLVRWWRDARSYAWADADKDKTQMGEEQSEETRRKDGIDRAMDLIGEGEISRAVAIATSEGAAAVTPYVKEQLRTKFPRRTKAVNSSIEGVATSCIAVHLMGELQQLPKGAAAGPNGMRNEFLRVLAQKFGGESAKEIGRRLKCVAEMIARRELPQWYYLLMSTTKLVPLIKSRNPGGPGPDVRPVAYKWGTLSLLPSGRHCYETCKRSSRLYSDRSR